MAAEITTIDSYRIAAIPGDGIGNEVLPAGVRVLDAAASRFGFALEWTHFPWSCETWARTGRMMPDDGIEVLAGFDAIYLGAVGFPGVPDHVSLWGLLIPIRRRFEQYVNLRPIRLFEGIRSPLHSRGREDIDLVVVRENSEGEYSEIGGRLFDDTDAEVVLQQSVFSRRGCDRIIRYAFELANTRPQRHVTSATKSNGIIHTMPYWDERFAVVAKDYADIRNDQYHVDALAANLVLHPDRHDVIVASNLLGDILSDLAAAVAGTLGIAASGNIDPTRRHPSMFEPVHGSAPDIAGQGIANPVGQILSGAMMLEHLGQTEAARAIEGAVENVLTRPQLRTRDLGGDASTDVAADAVVAALAGDTQPE